MKKDFLNDRDLQLKPNDHSKPIDKGNRMIGEALRVIREWGQVLDKKLQQNDKIDDVLDDTMTVIDRDRNSPMPSYLLQSVRFKIRRRMQPPDWRIVSEGVTNEEAVFLMKGIEQKMNEGGWQEFMTGKWGVADKVVTYGDAFGRIASFKNKTGLTDKEKERIVIFENTGTASLYWGSFTTELINPGGEGKATQVVAVKEYSWEVAISFYPEIEDLAEIGMLPETEEGYGDDSMTDEQRSFIDDKKIQLGFFHDSTRKIYGLIAGRNATEIFQFSGKEYPFILSDSEAYLPFLHFYCFAGIEGLYNQGVCGLFYSLDAVWTELLNRSTAYIMQNVDPIQIVSLQPDQRADFYQELEAAQEAQEIGGRPFIVNETDDPRYGTIQTSQAQALTNEFERLVVQLRSTADMLGVKLDELSAVAGKPLGTTELELQNQNETVKAIINNWKGAIEFAVKVTMDSIKRDVKDDDEELVEGDVQVTREDEQGGILRDEIGTPLQAKVEGVTMGDVAKMLRDLDEKKIKTKIVIDTISGATKSNSVEIAAIQNELALTPPGTLHYNMLRKRLANLRGFNVDENSFNNPQAQLDQQGQANVPTQQDNRLQLA